MTTQSQSSAKTPTVREAAKAFMQDNSVLDDIFFFDDEEMDNFENDLTAFAEAQRKIGRHEAAAKSVAPESGTGAAL